jgi:ADP-ribose pyrophosphatase YjhB (NUDIX family)
MREVVRAIIVKEESLLTIKRVKNDQTFWVFPGGGVDEGEEYKKALIRECEEELGLEVEVLDLMSEYTFNNETLGEQKEYFYNCNILGGELGTGNGPEYNQTEPNSRNKGSYEPVWIKLSELADFNLRPAEIKNELLSLLNK